MALKVASRFESIRQSLKYKRLLDLQVRSERHRLPVHFRCQSTKD